MDTLNAAVISDGRERLAAIVARLHRFFREEKGAVADLDALREIRALQAVAEDARELATYLASEAFMLDVVTRSTEVEAE